MRTKTANTTKGFIMAKQTTWYKCDCGKLHILTYNLGGKSICSCGKELPKWNEV